MAGAQQACRDVVGRKLEWTSEPGGGSSPVSDKVLGSACRNRRAFWFDLSSPMMGICPVPQRILSVVICMKTGQAVWEEEGLSGIPGEAV